jgi:endonuclease/exonuclease/phosphatase family metal-dependent hydrolase
MRGKTYRFINAHTEAFHPGVQYAQAAELLEGPANTSLPVILAGDLNSDAEANGASYLLLTGMGFADAWEIAEPNDSGYTWPLFLDSPSIFTDPAERLDLVLFRGPFRVSGTDILGEDPATDVTSSGLRPSDHAGVAATLVLAP